MKNLFLLLVFISSKTLCQTIGTFSSVVPMAQTEQFVIPSTHKFQKLMQSGDLLSNGTAMKGTPDFTCYVPISGSSTNGYISLNHETAPGGISIFDVNYNNSFKLWQIAHAEAADLTAIDGLTIANCSGGLTPWGTVLSGEEYISTTDVNADGYNDAGWLIEVNPVTRKVIRKLWALGCMQHENAAVASDGSKIYFGADMFSTGFLYKFVCTTANDPTAGILYALKLSSGGNGDWVVIPNVTQSDRNNTVSLATAAGATNISGIEDVEIGPDGKIYVTSKYDQQIYRFTDNGLTVSNYETYISNQCYNINGVCEPYGYAGQNGNDNLAFDGEGNLWVLQDGGRNHIWVVGPAHIAGGTNDVRLFATTPAGCEPTGITFSPDYKFMFLSIQHPNGSNMATQTDAAGNSVVFNRGTTLVIARSEFLGTPTVPIDIQDFTAQVFEKNQVALHWLIHNKQFVNQIVIERSSDGVHFEKIGQQAPPQYIDQFIDENPHVSKNYYRLKFIENDGKETFTKILSISFAEHLLDIHVASNPFDNETTVFYSNLNRNDKLVLCNIVGGIIWSKNLADTEGGLSVGASLPSGVYFLRIENNQNQIIKTIKLLKTKG